MRKIFYMCFLIILLMPSITTNSKEVESNADGIPELIISNIQTTPTTLSYTVEIIDPNGYVYPGSAYTYIEGSSDSICILNESGLTNCSHENLQPNTTYTVHGFLTYFGNPNDITIEATATGLTRMSAPTNFNIYPLEVTVSKGEYAVVTIEYDNLDSAVINKVIVDGIEMTPILAGSNKIQLYIPTSNLEMGVNYVEIESMMYFDNTETQYAPINQIITINIIN